jgi:hypothetical protein
MLEELNALSPPLSNPLSEDSDMPPLLVLPPDLLSSVAALLRESINPAAWALPVAITVVKLRANNKRCLVFITARLLFNCKMTAQLTPRLARTPCQPTSSVYSGCRAFFRISANHQNCQRNQPKNTLPLL